MYPALALRARVDPTTLAALARNLADSADAPASLLDIGVRNLPDMRAIVIGRARTRRRRECAAPRKGERGPRATVLSIM